MTFEESLLKGIQEMLIKAMSEYAYYNSPLRKPIEMVMERYSSKVAEIFEKQLKESLDDETFKIEVKKAITQKVARTLINESESCISRSVQKLKQNEAFRAKLVLAIDNIIEEFSDAD